MNINVLNLFDEDTNSMREVVPLEDVYALLDEQRKEFALGMKDLCDKLKVKIDETKQSIEVEEIYAKV